MRKTKLDRHRVGLDLEPTVIGDSRANAIYSIDRRSELLCGRIAWQSLLPNKDVDGFRFAGLCILDLDGE